MNFKINFIKKLSATLLAAAVFTAPLSSFASVLGSSKISGYTTQIGEGTYYTHNIFYSDQSGVGKQTENYIVYTPNSTVLPTITNGASLFGTTAISKETNRLENLDTDIIGGSNADFFSTQTGVPMSNAIVDGKILTKDASGQDAIGIMPDGTAFISYFSLNSVLIKEDGSEANIYNINKYRQPYAIYMMTSDFYNETKNTTKGIDVILGSIEGEMKIGTRMTAVVESVNEVTGSAPIPEGKIVITVDAKAPAEFLDPIASLKEGEKVTLSFSANGDPRWSEVALGMGSVGGRLLINGEINPNLSAGAAPRTAIGIKDDGSIVLYTIDGRQTGYSYGVQLKTLASRMKELGCIEALNLDGGGSTQMVVQLPGDDKSSLINKPSDGKERGVSTFFFFKNTAKRTGKAEMLHLYPKTNYILKGASVQLELKATDLGFHPASVPSSVTYSVEDGKNSTISDGALFTAKDNGSVTVYAQSGDAKTSLTLTCLETPTDIVIKNKDTWEDVKALAMTPSDTVELSALAYGGYNQLTASRKNFVWEADPQIGTISDIGLFKASDKYGASGNIRVSAGKKTITIPVTLAKPSDTDPKAYPVIDINFAEGTLTGTISCEYNISTEKDKIIIRADGKPVDFEYDSKIGELFAELSDAASKITVYATNSFGYTSFKTLISDTAVLLQSPFADTAGHWAEGLLGYMHSAKIINGDPTDGTLRFNPQKQMTRSEFSVMICNYLGLKTEDYENTNLPYSDLDGIPAWALPSFKALYAEGIVKGRYVSDTESCADPLSTISRAEAATIVARTLPAGVFKSALTASDREDIPAWASDGVTTLISLGAMKGYEDGTLKPLNTLTKAEAAKILYSVM
ncbi:MAG: phosphodiester glycosidase family protein [Clostridia bacterium]|nr:phosphodiester glycosidase family protein [Clostridia bacterium]